MADCPHCTGRISGTETVCPWCKIEIPAKTSSVSSPDIVTCLSCGKQAGSNSRLCLECAGSLAGVRSAPPAPLSGSSKDVRSLGELLEELNLPSIKTCAWLGGIALFGLTLLLWLKPSFATGFVVFPVCLGAVLVIVSKVALVIAGFRAGVLWGLCMILIPGVALAFILLRWKYARGPVLIGFSGLLVMLLGALVTLPGQMRGRFAIDQEYLARVSSRPPPPLKEPTTSQEFHERGITRSDSGDLEGAIADFTSAISLHPRADGSYYNRALAKGRKGDQDGAFEDYSQAIAIYSRHVNAYVARGNIRQERRDFDGAIQDYNNAIHFVPRSHLAYFNRGRARAEKGDLEEALSDYSRSIDLEPRFVPAFTWRAGVKSRKGDLEGALSDCTKAIQLDPNDPVHYLERGSFFRKKEDYVSALRDYEKALQLAPPGWNRRREAMEAVEALKRK